MVRVHILPALDKDIESNVQFESSKNYSLDNKIYNKGQPFEHISPRNGRSTCAKRSCQDFMVWRFGKARGIWKIWGVYKIV